MSNSLPYGWIERQDQAGDRPYYIDSNATQPRATWAHPYDDDQHPEIREIPVTVTMLTRDQSALDVTPYIFLDRAEDRYSIGNGAFGNVYRRSLRYRDSNTQRMRHMNVVVKTLLGTAEECSKIEKRLNREIAAWRNLRHPNINELLGIAYLDNNLPPGLVSKWIQRNDFMAYIERHPGEKREMATDIAHGVQYLHDNGVVHGDLKVDNILVSDDRRALIIDFGIAQILGVIGYTYTTCVQRNIRYTAPELMPISIIDPAESVDVRPTRESDIYSLGILFLQLFHGAVQGGQPYNHIPPTIVDYPLLSLIHGGERPIRGNYNLIHDRHWYLMKCCWNSEPSQRPVIAQVLQAL